MFANRSKELLYRYINSEIVLSTIGQKGCDSIVSFLRGYVFPHAARFAGYVYFNCRSFEAHANTPLEGTNRGLKYGEFAVKPNMQADRSTKQMLIQDQNKAVENMKQASKELHQTKLYTSTRTSTVLNTVSESMLANEMKQAENYLSVRTHADHLRWDVLRCDTKISQSPQPQFQRVRTVQVDDKGVMCCSCGFFIQNGIPCRHMCHVSKNYRSNFEWTEMDVDVRHFSGYTFFLTSRSHSEMDDLGRATQALYRKRRSEPFLGPLCNREEFDWSKMVDFGSGPINIFSGMDLSTLRKYCEARRGKLNVINMEVDAVQLSLSLTENHAGGMTQETHIGDDDSDGKIEFESDDVDKIPLFGALRGSERYDAVQPVFKEMMAEMENASPDLFHQGVEWMRQYIFTMRKERVRSAPVGAVVSCAVPAANPSIRHKKQRLFADRANKK
jgi:SWIM zinc finger